jgi:hypothetical protein
MAGMLFRTRIRHIIALFGVAFAASTVLGNQPIYVQPGQCIMVGAQQVCAAKVEGAAVVAEVSYACRFGEHRGGDLPGYKTYGLVKLTTGTNGKVSETLIKDFGLKGKEKCDAAAADRK